MISPLIGSNSKYQILQNADKIYCYATLYLNQTTPKNLWLISLV